MHVTLKGFRFGTFVLVCLISIANAQQNNERPDPRSEFVVVAVSPDGAQLAVARSSYDIITRNGRFELWDLKSGELRETVTGFDGSISNITFSRDGKSIITTSTEVRQSKLQPKPLDRSGDSRTELKWWDANTGEFIRKTTLDQFSGEVVFSPDGSTIAVVQHSIYSYGYGFTAEPLGAPYEKIRRLTDKRPVYESFDIRLLDAATGTTKLKMSGKVDSFVYSWGLQFVPSVFSSDGRLFAVAAAREVKVWDVSTGEKFQRIREIDGSPLAIAFSPDSQTIAVSSGEVSSVDRKTIHESEISVWNVSTAKLVRNLRGKSDFVASLKFASNGKALLFGTLQYEPERTIGTVKVWDFVTNRLATFNVHEGQKVTSIQLLSDRAELLLLSGEDVELRDTRSWRIKHSFDPNQEARGSRSASRFLLSVKQVVEIGFSSDGITVSGVVPDEGVRLWDSRTGGMKRAQEINVTSGLIARSANGRVLGEATAQKIKLWDLASGTDVTISRAESTPISAFALSSDGKLMAVAEGPRVKLRNSFDETLSRSLSHESVVKLLAFSSDGRVLVSADEAGTLKIWDVGSGQLKRTISTGNIVTSLTINPTGQLVATAGADYLISVWNEETGALQLRLKKHENVINALAFSPDSKTLASGGDDRTVVLWDMLTGKPGHILKGHDVTVTSLAFSPTGEILASGSGNATVVLWNVNNGKVDRVLR